MVWEIAHRKPSGRSPASAASAAPMYPAGTNVSDARKALKIKGFRAVRKCQKQPKRAALIVSGKMHKKPSGHSSQITNTVDNFNTSAIMELN